MKEELGPSKKYLRKSKWLAEKQERREWLNARVTKADSDADDLMRVSEGSEAGGAQ
jgi:hypothetical protein